jgi:hypothetical protein
MSDIVNRGTQPGDPSADTTFDAFGKINSAFEDVDIAIDGKVDKVAGKGLSTDDFHANGDYPNLRAGATTKDDVGLGNVENLSPEQIRSGTTKEHVGLENVENLTPSQIRAGITKEDIGLGNVENLTPAQIRDGITKEHVGLANVENLTPAQIRAGITKDDVGLGNVENYGIATEAEAKAGTANNKYMTPLRTSDYFNKRVLYGTSAPDNNNGDDGDFYFQYEL